MEIQITLEEFRLIKSFYPEFTRKQGITSNDFIIGWSELMPVVEKIESIQYKKYLYEIKGYTFIITGRCARITDIEGEAIIKQQVCNSKIEAVYKAVVEFILYHNSQKR